MEKKKRYSIKWRKEDKTRINKAIRAYNAKVKYYGKQEKYKGLLPSTESLKHAKDLIKTRSDYNNYVRRLERFNKIKGAPKIVKNKQGQEQLQYVRQEINYGIQAVNKRRAAERKKQLSADIYVNGKKIDTASKAQLRDELKQIKWSADDLTKTSAVESFKMIEKQIYESYGDYKAQILRENLVKSFETIGVDKKRIKMYKERLYSLTDDELNELYYQFEDELNPSFIYAPQIDYDEKINGVEVDIDGETENVYYGLDEIILNSEKHLRGTGRTRKERKKIQKINKKAERTNKRNRKKQGKKKK